MRSLQLHVALSVGGLLGGYAGYEIQPPPAPVRFAPRVSDGTLHVVSPDEDIGTIFAYLQTVDDLAVFLRMHTHSDEAGNPLSFLSRFRQSPASLQRDGWKGTCNNFAEFTAEWAYRHSGIPYIVTLWPKGSLSKLRESWHQLTACRLPDGRLLLFDNTEIFILRGTLACYVAGAHEGKEIPSIGGIIEWQLARDTPLAKFHQHLALPSITEDAMRPCDLPRAASSPAPQLANR